MAYFNKYVGIPFKEKGSDFKGCDCWGLVRLFYKEEYGINLTDFTLEYKDTGDPNTVNLFKREQENARKTTTPKQGDIMVFFFAGHLHVGIWLNGRKMLHVMERTNAAIERHTRKWWTDRIQGVFTYDI